MTRSLLIGGTHDGQWICLTEGICHICLPAADGSRRLEYYDQFDLVLGEHTASVFLLEGSDARLVINQLLFRYRN